MNRKISSAEMFTLAAKAMSDDMGRGAQRDIATAMRVSQAYLNDLLLGRRNWSDRLRDAFATAIGVRVADILLIGEGIHKTGFYFPHTKRVAGLQANSYERAAEIFKLAASDAGLHLHMMFTPETLRAAKLTPVDKYVSSEFGDGELYEYMRNYFSKAIKITSKK